jgi:hypothetical protein
MLLETICERFRLARAVNCTNTSYTSIVPTITEPSGDAGTAGGNSVIDLGKGGMLVQNGIKVVPFGAGSDTNTFSVRVWGWQKIKTSVIGNSDLWVPVNLGEFACTLSTPAGVDNTPVPSTNVFCDTITVTVGSTLGGEAAGENIISPANDTTASFMVDLRGYDKVQLDFTTGSSATSCNALISLV